MTLLQKFLQTLKHTFSCNITDLMRHFWDINHHRSLNLWWRSAINCGIQQKQQWKQCIAERIDNKSTSQIVRTRRRKQKNKTYKPKDTSVNLVAMTNITHQHSDAIFRMHSPVSTISHNKHWNKLFILLYSPSELKETYHDLLTPITSLHLSQF